MQSLIGSRVLRIEDDALLRGRGRFVDDIAAPAALLACEPLPRDLPRLRQRVQAL